MFTKNDTKTLQYTSSQSKKEEEGTHNYIAFFYDILCVGSKRT